MESVKARGYENLKGMAIEPADPQELLRMLVKEGDALLAAEEPATPVTALESALGSKSNNPYIRARIKILNDLPPKVRSEIEHMEKTGKINNSVYRKFTVAIALLGDKLSS